jgi:hypothetical protein
VDTDYAKLAVHHMMQKNRALIDTRMFNRFNDKTEENMDQILGKLL